MTAGWTVGVDIGGTFTDVVAVGGEPSTLWHVKVPSSRRDPASSVINGLRAVSEKAGVTPSEVRVLMHGTTLATNAIIERRLAKTALVTTKGFRDVLEIGRHWRTELYDPFIDEPAPLVPRRLRFEARERLDASGEELEPLDRDDAADICTRLRKEGVESVAVVFLHSYKNPRHEHEMAQILRAASSWYVCASSELSREIREYERTSTTTLNAALLPLIDAYLFRLESLLEQEGSAASLLITQSNGGGLTPRAARTRPVALAMSGPVGGVVGCVVTARTTGYRNMIGFDMGGTSTDVSVITNYEPRSTNELRVGDFPIRLPSIDVHSIGAGGGSIARVDDGGALHVGPESAGAEPGPASYGRGGTSPTVTDGQLVLGRLAEDFPLAGRLTLRRDLAEEAIATHVATPLGMGVDEAAAGIVEIANAAMEGAIRVALRQRGDDPRDFALMAFGGAGPLHAAELAQRLGIRTVIVPPSPGTFSALGFLSADVRLDFAVSSVHRSGEPGLGASLAEEFAALEAQALAEFQQDGRLGGSPVTFERSCDVRYVGQAYEVSVPIGDGEIDDGETAALFERFHALHERHYAFASPSDPCEIVTLRVFARAPLERPPATTAPRGVGTMAPDERIVYVSGLGRVPAAVYRREALPAGATVEGPAIVHQADSTTYLPPRVTAAVDDAANLVLTLPGGNA
jgi:N-methylhydantoinase A